MVDEWLIDGHMCKKYPLPNNREKNRLLIKKIEFLSFNREYIKIIVVWESLRTAEKKRKKVRKSKTLKKHKNHNENYTHKHNRTLCVCKSQC